MRVVLEPLDETEPTTGALTAAWTDWIERGPQGPIEDEADDAFPT